MGSIRGVGSIKRSGLDQKAAGLALCENDAGVRQIERTDALVFAVRDLFWLRAVSRRFPDLPVIGGVALSGEEDMSAVERNVGVSRGCERRKKLALPFAVASPEVRSQREALGTVNPGFGVERFCGGEDDGYRLRRGRTQ